MSRCVKASAGCDLTPRLFVQTSWNICDKSVSSKNDKLGISVPTNAKPPARAAPARRPAGSLLNTETPQLAESRQPVSRGTKRVSPRSKKMVLLRKLSGKYEESLGKTDARKWISLCLCVLLQKLRCTLALKNTGPESGTNPRFGPSTNQKSLRRLTLLGKRTIGAVTALFCPGKFIPFKNGREGTNSVEVIWGSDLGCFPSASMAACEPLVWWYSTEMSSTLQKI